MFGANQLILPLLGGYLFLTRCAVTNYVAKQSSGNRLLFDSAVAGAVLFSLAVILVSLCKDFIPGCADLLGRFFPSSYSYLDSAALAFLLGPLGSWLINRFKKEGWTITNIQKFGSPIQVFQAKALSENRQVSITLNSGKVYVGFISQLNESLKGEDYLLLWPLLSGYRDKEDKIVVFTTNYAAVYEAIREQPNAFAMIDVKDFQLVLPINDLESISIFDPNVYACFQDFETPDRLG
ncbi:hypothetical protein IQ254_17570 [Nodosilinea sp. LEGE 07088]|uniref:hypothetical protein n=1 Tax=Nodosilinea sp. LEGE 07088 TaxID=2777968 RepID=UPI0018825D96|nr:hypothetical protein [Nodosilinea sp. LEGE 07088]MBE9138978.1 hypothetical protein [Nodosilinea sp. LEGE 07088]